jgi:hypothetical protein
MNSHTAPRPGAWQVHLLATAALAGFVIAGALMPTESAEGRSQFFVERFTGAKLSAHLQDTDSEYQLEKGSIHRKGEEGPASANRHYITTVRHDYASGDWMYEITFFSPLFAPDDILFIGVGEALPDPEYFNEPRNSLNFRIHQGEFAFFTNWRVDVAAHSVGFGEFTYFDMAIGFLPPNGPDGGLFTARIRKIGSQLTFEILDTDPPIVTTVADLASAAPFLDATNSRIFFGNASGAYAYGDMRVSPPAIHKGH